MKHIWSNISSYIWSNIWSNILSNIWSDIWSNIWSYIWSYILSNIWSYIDLIFDLMFDLIFYLIFERIFDLSMLGIIRLWTAACRTNIWGWEQFFDRANDHLQRLYFALHIKTNKLNDKCCNTHFSHHSNMIWCPYTWESVFRRQTRSCAKC